MVNENATLVTNIKGYLKQLGYDVIDSEYYNHINEWYNWYRNKVDSFRKYNIYNGYQFVEKERFTLGMPKQVSEDWASLLYNDNTSITVDDEQQTDLDIALFDNKFSQKFAKLMELTFALGTGATVVYKKDGDVKIDYINALMIFPIHVENDEIISCAFASVINDYYYVNIHIKEDDHYKIINKYIKKSGNCFVDVKGGQAEEETTSMVKMFQIYKPNITNNIDIFSPFGISCFGNAICENKDVDICYDSFKDEFDLGRKRLMLPTDTLTYKTVVNEEGETTEIPIFDREQTEFYALPLNDEEGNSGITEINPTLRVTEHIDALQTKLNLLSSACGLGPDRYSFKDGKVYTNETQVISTNSKLYKNIKNHEKLLTSSLSELVQAVLYAVTDHEYEGDISIDYDDSIVEDTAEIKRQALLELNAGLIDNIQYYIDVYKMTEEQAIEFDKKIKERSPVEEEPPEEE